MYKQPIRNLRTSKSMPPRFCDFVDDGDNTYLELKNRNGQLVTIMLDDFLYQISVAVAATGKKLPQPAP